MLPATGPADVARRAAAVGASAGAGFRAAAAEAWAEWPEVLQGEVLRRLRAAGRAAPGRDRTLLAGDLAALGEAAAPLHPRLAAWLREAGPPPQGPRPPLRCGPHRLALGVKTYVVAILNRTTDSFSEEREDLPPVEELVARAWAAHRAGADIVDIGAESSEERERGSLSADAEARRLIPVLQALTDLPAVLSVDTRRAEVAARALGVLPVVVNDVDAAVDPGMAAVVAGAGAPLVLMHAGPVPAAGDPVAAVAAGLRAALARARAGGVDGRQLLLDAGFGFGTTSEQDLEITRRLGELRALGHPLLHAPSRKRTIGRVLAFPETIPERLPGTAALVVAGIAAGADLVRVHDVQVMARVARAADAVWRPGCWREIAAP